MPAVGAAGVKGRIVIVVKPAGQVNVIEYMKRTRHSVFDEFFLSFFL